MSIPDLAHAVWRKSSHSGGTESSDCVEVALVPGSQGAALRDSKDPGGGVLFLPPDGWQAFRATAGGAAD